MINTDPQQFQKLLEMIPPEVMPDVWFIPLGKGSKSPDVPKGGSAKDEKYRLTPEQAVDRLKIGCNVGIYATPNGLLFLDADTDKGNIVLPEEIRNTIPVTLTIKTRNGGLQYYYINNGTFKNKVHTYNGMKAGEIRADWYYVVSPGSYVQPDEDAGKDAEGIYKIINPAPIIELDTLPAGITIKADMPKKEIEIKTQRIWKNDIGMSLEEIRAKDEKLDKLLSGPCELDYPSRSEADMGAAQRLYFWRFNDSEIAMMLQEYRPYEKTARRDYIETTISKIASGERYNPEYYKGKRQRAPKKEYPQRGTNNNQEQRSKYLVTDIANAHRFVEMYNKDVVFVPERQKWYAWNGKIWEEQPNERMYEHAHKTVMNMYKIIPEIPSDTERMAFSKSVPRCEDTYKIKGMLEQSKPYLLEKSDNLDKYPMCFVVDNGVINLDTLQFEPHDRNRKITKMSCAVYDPTAKCPKWEEDLNKAFKGNKETIRFFQKAAGYSMTGKTGEQCFFILWGDGANLKTTLMEVVCAVLGDYHKDMDIKTIQEKQKNSSSPSPELAILAGARLVKCGENKEEFRLSEGLVKQITGSDGKIVCRRLHENDSSFMPEFKLFIYTNHKPQIKGTDYGIWRRVKLIPFTYKIPDSEKIPDYHKTIINEELSGVLNWMLEGIKLWKQEGIGTCPDVEEATTKFREENDTILQFINEHCDVVKTGTVGSQILYDIYVNDFCKPMGENYLTQREFKNKVEDKGFEHKKSKHGHYYQGLKLKTNNESLENNEKVTPGDTRKHDFPIENANTKIRVSGVTTCHPTPADSENNTSVTESKPVTESCGICGLPLYGHEHHDVGHGLGQVHVKCEYMPVKVKFLTNTRFISMNTHEPVSAQAGDIVDVPAMQALRHIANRLAERVPEPDPGREV